MRESKGAEIKAEEESQPFLHWEITKHLLVRRYIANK